MTEHGEMLELVSVYALGALDGDDLEAFEAHLAAGCEECEQELRLALSVADDLVGGPCGLLGQVPSPGAGPQV